MTAVIRFAEASLAASISDEELQRWSFVCGPAHDWTMNTSAPRIDSMKRL